MFHFALLAVVAKVRQWMEQEKSAVLQKDGQLQAASRVQRRRYLNLLPFLVRKANAESSKSNFFLQECIISNPGLGA